MILEEFDYDRNAFMEPEECCEKINDMPKVAVSCFSKVTFDYLLHCFNHKLIGYIRIANMDIGIYEVDYKGKRIALFNSYVGAAACIGVLEELFAMGVDKLILFGTCGVLDKSIDDCSIIIPDSAVRDEGTSYHYAAPSDEIKVNEKYIEEFKKFLDEIDISYTVGKVWTTDAFYRETREKVARRKKQGCICVDMECSAVAALGKFRNKDILHFFYAADNLDGEAWDERSLDNNDKIDEKHKIALIAMEIAVRMV